MGADGSVWVIGMNSAPQRWNGNNWISISGGGANIAVDPKGNPWVTNAGNEIWHWNGTSWALIPGSAKDIAIGADGTPYIVSTGAAPGGFSIHRRSGTEWQPQAQAGVRLAAGPAGKIYVVQD
ncbi:MAG: tectonin domain-containing protein, partial [Acidobacteriota bacterium]